MANDTDELRGSLVLMGTEGLVEGEVFRINRGESVILGRSRSCDISLRKCFKYLALAPDERKDDRHFQTVSRKHLRLIFKEPDQIELENLGANGTFIDGTKVDKVIITDVRFQPHEILLGTREKFRLEWRETGKEEKEEEDSGAEEAPPATGHEDEVAEGSTRRVRSSGPPGETWETGETGPDED
jgi:pSer/pThr/pTyr-binding forkhead associated (FHA) protein